MAQDQTVKRQAIAAHLVTGAHLIMQGLREMEAAGEEYQKAGLTFVQADFDQRGDLAHLTPTIASNGIGAAGAFRTWLDSSFNITNFELL